MGFDNDLISIVVPIYKVEKYLDDCVKSILNQTYTNIEIILVDDGSPDDCPRMCDAYALQDSRVKVVHQANGGLSKARNTGLKNSNGKYIAFIDSDDCISLDMIEKLYSTIKENDCQVACCRYYRFNDYSKIENTESLELNSKVVVKDNVEALEFIYDCRFKNIDFVAWNKLYLKTLFDDHNIEYPVGKLYEDIFTTYKPLYYAQNIVFLNQELYFYRQRSGSIMHQPLTMKRLDAIEGHEECLKFYFEKGEYRLLGIELNACISLCKYLLKISNLMGNESDKQRFTSFILDRAKMNWNLYFKISDYSIIRRIYYCIKYYAIIYKKEVL